MTRQNQHLIIASHRNIDNSELIDRITELEVDRACDWKTVHVQKDLLPLPSYLEILV